MKNAPRSYRQGDILLIEANKVSTRGAREEAPVSGFHVLASGEATGHTHAIAEAEDSRKLLALPDGRRLLQMPTLGGALVHPEHGTIQLPAGTFIVRRQRTFALGEERDEIEVID